MAALLTRTSAPPKVSATTFAALERARLRGDVRWDEEGLVTGAPQALKRDSAGLFLVSDHQAGARVGETAGIRQRRILPVQ